MEKLKFTDPNWMVWRVLRQDDVETDAKSSLEDSYLARTGANLLKGLVLGYRAKYRVLPDERVVRDVDYTHLGTEGSLGWNAPMDAVENRGRVVKRTFYHERHGKVSRPTNSG